MPTYPTYKLGDVAEIINGKNQKEVVSPQGKYPIYGSGGIIGWATDYLCKENSTIIGRKGTIDSPIFVNRKFWNVDTAFGIQPSEKVLPRYLFFFCKSFDFKKLDKSTTIPSLAKRDLLQIPIPLPPLATQQAIVTRIESLFAELDKGVEHLRTAQQQLKTYRQAVLNQMLNNEDGKWEMVKLGEICSVLGDGLHGTPKFVENGDFYFINGNNLNGVIVIKQDTKTTNLEEFEKYKKNLNERTILISINGTLGNIAYYNGEPVVLGKSSCYFNLLDGIEKDYVKYCLLSERFRSYAFKNATGSTIKNVPLKAMRMYSLPLPPLAEQQRIVKEIESRLSQATASETYIENALQQAEALRQSILKKAFSGELV